MGVKLGEIILKKELKWEDLKNKKIAVDSSNCLYQFLSSIRQRDGALLTDSKGRITSHLIGLFSRTANLMQQGAKLCYIFDGKPPLLKVKIQEEREYKKRIAEEKFKEAKEKEDIAEMYKYSKQTARLTPDIVNESKELLKAMGLPVIQSPAESDAQMAFMNEKNDIDFSASSDMDCLLYGTPRLITNLTLSQRRKLPSGSYIKITPELIELKPTLKALKITQDQLIALGILVGSVDHNEPTIIKNDGAIKVIPIGECPKDHPIQVPCFDIKTKKIRFKKVKKFIKHKINEPIYEITTTYNRKVKVTGSHSLFIKNNKGILAVQTTELKKGDKLVVPVRIPLQNKEVKKINLAQELWKHRNKIKRSIYCDGKNIQKIIKKRLLNKKHSLADKRYILTKFGLTKLKKLRLNKKITTTKTPLGSTTVHAWEKGLRNPTETKFKRYLKFLKTNLNKFNKENKSIKGIRDSFFEEIIFPRMNHTKKYRQTMPFKILSKKEIDLLSEQDFIYGRTRATNPVSPILNITPELIRLIGYFLAEGHLNGDYRVNFSFALEGIGHDNYCVNDTIYCIKKVFKAEPKVYHEKSTRHICLDNCVIHDFFAYILELEKQDSKTKKIPTLIFNINPKLQLEFLKGFFLGDGSLDKDRIFFSTASLDLATGLSYIFLQQGIISSTTVSNEKNYNMKTLSVCGKNQLIKFKKIWENHNKSKILIEHCKKPLKQRQNIETEGDLGYVKIKSIKSLEPSKDYVYDFSVDGENFIAGFGGICCHNTDYNPGGVKGIGPKTALKLVHQYKSFDTLFKEVKAEFNWKEIYAIFKSMPIMKNYQLKWSPPNEEAIKKLLIDKHEFSEERVNKALDRLKKSKSKKEQSALDKWTK